MRRVIRSCVVPLLIVASACGGGSTTSPSPTTTTSPSTTPSSATASVAITIGWFGADPTSLAVDGINVPQRHSVVDVVLGTGVWVTNLTRGTHQVQIVFPAVGTDQPVIGFFGVKAGSLVLVSGPTRTLIDTSLGLIVTPEAPGFSAPPYGAGAKVAFPPYAGSLVISFTVN